jgi:hypothetical protein
MTSTWWSTVASFAGPVVFCAALVALGALFGSIPDKWDKAVALKVCGGVTVVQLEDGTVWLRGHWRAYRVENWRELC